MHFNREKGRQHKPSYWRYYSDRVVFVSGAASGIGRAMARSLYACGSRLVLADVNGQSLRELGTELGNDEDRLMIREFDVRDRTAFDDCFRDVVETWGTLDLVFNNAGICIFGDTLEFTAEDWEKLVDINVKGTINGTVSAIQQMKNQGHGKVVNMASITGLVPFPGVSGYSATKHAVVAFTRCLEVECEDLGIEFCTICPGVVRTSMVTGGQLGAVRGANKEEHLKRADRAGQMDVDEFVSYTLATVAKGKSLIIVPRRYVLWAYLARGLGDRISRWLVRKLYRMTYKDA
jgi:NADP-dependent 3-hydroxy acid dehydrogenase YdfG